MNKIFQIVAFDEEAFPDIKFPSGYLVCDTDHDLSIDRPYQDEVAAWFDVYDDAVRYADGLNTLRESQERMEAEQLAAEMRYRQSVLGDEA